MKVKRNRIVIDFGGARPAKSPAALSTDRSKSRVGLVLGIIAAVLIMIVLGAAAGVYLWWRHYQAQPAYSLALLIDAAQRNDNATLDSLVDIDKIIDNLVAQVRDGAAGTIISPLVGTQADESMARLTPKLKESIRDELGKAIQRLTAPAVGKPFALIALGVPYFVDVKRDGATARASAKIKDEQVRLTMQQNELGRWQIVAVEDDKLAELITESVNEDLSQSGKTLQDEIQKQLKQVKLPGKSK